MKQFASSVHVIVLSMRPLPHEPSDRTACNAAAPCPTLRIGVRGLALAAPRDAPAGTARHTGLVSGLSPDRVDALHRDAVEGAARAARPRWATGDAVHDGLQSLGPRGRGWGAVARVGGQGAASGDRATPRPPRAAWRRDHPRGPTRGDGMGYAGHKPEHGAKVLAMPDHQGSGWAPGPVAPVPATAMVLCPEGLNALKRLATAGGLDRRGA